MGGKQSTHIANGYGREIQVRVTFSKAYLKRVLTTSEITATFGSSVAMTVEREFERHIIVPGFIRIPSGGVIRFDVTGDDGNVYVTIKADGKVIADNFPLENDYSIVVSSSGYIRRAKYGEVWIDNYGIDHEIKGRAARSIDIKSIQDFIEKRDLK